MRGVVKPRLERADLVDANFLGRGSLARSAAIGRATGGILRIPALTILLRALLERHGFRAYAPEIRVVSGGHPPARQAFATGKACHR